MKRKFLAALFLAVLIGCCFYSISNRGKSRAFSDYQTEVVTGSSSFDFKTGDILVRPNWGWLPGSCSVPDGRRYGHVAIVTEGASGKTVDEALSKATVVEAVFFDQATRKFQFRKEDQIRERNASVSFGNRFKGIRYRMRMNLTDAQAEELVFFLRNQLDGGYNILSLKRRYKSVAEKEFALKNLKNANWHCATLAREVYVLVAGADIDANGGIFIYPADIVASKCFDVPGGRIRF